MIAIYMDPSILDAPIKVGADADGLSRDAYSAFWKEFFLTSACGEDERVPAIVPYYGRDEWEGGCRQNLAEGYLDTGIYPLQLSYAFSVAVIHGEHEVTPDIMSESIKMYLCETDRCVIDKALCGDGLDEDHKDDFLYLLSRVNCHAIPRHDEVWHYVLSIVHKQLIEEPKCALDAIASPAREGLQLLLPWTRELGCKL